MKPMIWFIVLASVAGVVYGLWRVRAKWEERNRASEERFAGFIAQALPGGALAAPKAAEPMTVPPIVAEAKANHEIAMQRLLLEAASKAGEAGEPALSIQLYAKLLSRYPKSTFAQQARAAVDTQKKKLVPAAKPS
jgi:hypothetical protein